MTELLLDQIHIQDRHRRDLGDITALADSMDTLGLIHPVVVTPDHRLVAGERRLAAARQLGWDVVEVTVIHSLGDYASLLEAERDENTCRKDFTPTEAATVRKAITDVLAPEAERRKAEAGKDYGKGHPKASGNLPPAKTRDVAAKGTGYSGRTLDKVDEVTALAESADTPDLVKDIAREALASMDTTGRVDGAYQLVKDAEARESLPQPDPAVTEILDNDQRLQNVKYIHAFSKAICRADDFLSFDAERIGLLADEAHLVSIEHLIKSATGFLERARGARHQLKVVR